MNTTCGPYHADYVLVGQNYGLPTRTCIVCETMSQALDQEAVNRPGLMEAATFPLRRNWADFMYQLMHIDEQYLSAPLREVRQQIMAGRIEPGDFVGIPRLTEKGRLLCHPSMEQSVPPSGPRGIIADSEEYERQQERANMSRLHPIHVGIIPIHCDYLYNVKFAPVLVLKSNNCIFTRNR